MQCSLGNSFREGKQNQLLLGNLLKPLEKPPGHLRYKKEGMFQGLLDTASGVQVFRCSASKGRRQEFLQHLLGYWAAKRYNRRQYFD